MPELRRFKFVVTLVLFKKLWWNKVWHIWFTLKSKAETIINESDTDGVFESIYSTIIRNIQKSSGKYSSWITDSVIEYNINISKCSTLAGSSYIKLLKELDHLRKRLINILNIDDNECIKWCLVRYVNPTDLYPG